MDVEGVGFDAGDPSDELHAHEAILVLVLLSLFIFSLSFLLFRALPTLPALLLALSVKFGRVLLAVYVWPYGTAGEHFDGR